MIHIANWSFPTSVRFGAGRASELAEAAALAGMQKPLMVTEKLLASLPMTERMRGNLLASGLAPGIFDEVAANPDDRNLAAGIAAFTAGGHDGVIALGGGSALDLGKAIAFQAGQSRPIWDFEDIGDRWKAADADAIHPVIAIPTTAGTGSEVGRASVITDSATHTKKVIFHPRMLPVQVICDPELTLSLPPHVTAGTGMDAFAHCLEAYCAKGYHPMADGIALEGMRLVKDHLERAYTDGSDLEARAQMMSAAMMGAVAFQKGLGMIHALSHPVGALFGTHHGTTNAVLMTQVLQFNRPAVEARLIDAACYLQVDGGFDGFLRFVSGLCDRLSIPKSLSAIGVDPASLERMAQMSIEDPTAGGNPRAFTVEEALGVYRQAI